jgi:ATP-dependent helicase/nuclease subunit A
MAKRKTELSAPGPEPASPVPDQAARDLIVHELDKSFLVEAAAGTGKTTSLVERMVSLISEGKCPVETMAAVTFTRKAAAELRGRFQVRLEQASATATGAVKDRLETAIEHVERAFLGTIHSFCGRLLRERPVEAGVDANFRELDETEDVELRFQAWEEHVARLTGGGDPVIGELRDLGVDLAQLKPAFERIAGYPDVDSWPALDVALPDPGPTVTALRSFVAHIKTLEKALPRDPGNDKLIPMYRRLQRAVRHADLARPAELLAVLEVFVKAGSDEPAEPAVIQKQWPEGKAQAQAEQEKWARFGENYAVPYVQALRRCRYAHVMRAIRPALEIYDAMRRDAGFLNFQDLLLFAARMLRENPAIRAYFRTRFTHLLIDEFQDTDPVQAEVMMLLTADDPSETNWRRTRPVSGSLFVVGDPKQSIYRFRRADIVTYNEVKRIIQATGGLVVSLSANFRAMAPIVEWVNASFSELFPAEATEFAPQFVLLQVGRSEDRPGAIAGLYRLASDGRNKQEILAAESRAVAQTIRHALDSGRAVPRSKREQTQKSEAKPDDFLVVTRNTTNLSAYARELEALGVPHQVTGGTTLNELPELALLSTCLRALVRPDDPVALVGALRSELFGISDAALYELKRAGGKLSFQERLPATGISADNLTAIGDAFRRLNLYFTWLDQLPAAACIEKITGDLGLLARACASAGGEVRAGSLAKALELIRSAQATHVSMLDLLEYLERLVKGEQKHDGIPVRPTEGSVVRLMNLHKVKGLEAPIVFLADPTGNFKHPIDLHIDRSGDSVRGYMAVIEPRQEGSHARPRIIALPTDWPRQEEAESDFQRAENDRLLYVAATRAGTCLIVSERGKLANENPWRSLAEKLGDREVHQGPGEQPPPLRPSVAVSLADALNAQKELAERWSTLRESTFEIKAVKKYAQDLAKQLGQLHKADGAPTRLPALPKEPPEDEEDDETGPLWGDEVHRLLEATMRGRVSNLEGLARSVTRAREDQVDDEDAHVQKLLDCVRSVYKSGIWQRAMNAKHVLPEVPLMMPDRSANERHEKAPLILRGVIDLAFREESGWVIVDYKTDQLKGRPLETLVEQHRPQVQKYAEAWSELIKESVHEFGLFFTRENRYVRLNGPTA